MSAQAILLGIQIANAISLGIPAAIRAKQAIDRMIAEGRDPTEAEWQQLNDVSAELRARLHGPDSTDGGKGG